MGKTTTANGANSVAIGEDVFANGTNSFALGQNIVADSVNSVVIGSGMKGGDPIVNNISNSLMVGFNRDSALFFVGPSGEGIPGGVGIGTCSPTHLLEITEFSPVSNLVKIKNADPNGLSTTSYVNDDESSIFHVGIYGTLNPISPGDGLIWAETDDNILFGTNNTQRMILTNTGSLGIGTPIPSALVHLFSVTPATLFIEGSDGSYIKFRESGYGDGFGIYTDFSGSGDANRLMFTTTSSGADPQETDAKLTILQGGNVGIGTTTPARTLHVNDVMRLEPRNGPPTGPAEGDLYYDSNEHKLKCYNGISWMNCF